jgi:G protein beta subunit-like protein
MSVVNNKGHCFIWTLNSGNGEEPTKLNPRHKITAHKGHALACKFSPDSTYDFF